MAKRQVSYGSPKGCALLGLEGRKELFSDGDQLSGPTAKEELSV
jgi:hypothetical protein